MTYANVYAKFYKIFIFFNLFPATENPNCNRLYLRKKVERNTAPSTRELYARVRFASIAAAVSDRSKDLSKIKQDQQSFIAQKDLAGGKKTLKAWYWMV